MREDKHSWLVRGLSVREVPSSIPWYDHNYTPRKQSTEGERERKMSAPSASGLLDKSDDYFELTRRFVNNCPRIQKVHLLLTCVAKLDHGAAYKLLCLLVLYMSCLVANGPYFRAFPSQKTIDFSC